MDELVHDLVSALEESSEQAARGGFGDGGDHALAVGCLLKRQARKRRGRKRRSDNPHPPWETGHLSEGSESSLDEHKDYRATTGSVASSNSHARDNSDSDEQLGPKRRTPLNPDTGRGKRPLWQEDLGGVGSAEGSRSLRRRRKVKRMAVDPPLEAVTSNSTTTMLGPPPVPKPHGGCRIPGVSAAEGRAGMELTGGGVGGGKCRVKKRKLAAHRLGLEATDEGVVVERGDAIMRQAGPKDKMEFEEQKGSDEDMSDSETSSVSNSSDGGLYTNDEGRQGDDEQSDWFFEGECGAGGMGIPSLLPSWDPDTPPVLEVPDPAPPTFLQPARPTQRGYHARLNRLPGVAARCIRKGRRRLPSKDNNMSVSMERMKHFSQDPYQWLPSIGKRDRSQFNPLCPLPVYPIDMVPDSSHRRCSSSICKTRQTNVHLGLLCTGDIKRRRKTTAVSVTTTSACIPFHKDDLGEDTSTSSTSLSMESAGPGPSTSDKQDFIKPGTLFRPSPQREQEQD